MDGGRDGVGSFGVWVRGWLGWDGMGWGIRANCVGYWNFEFVMLVVAPFISSEGISDLLCRYSLVVQTSNHDPSQIQTRL